MSTNPFDDETSLPDPPNITRSEYSRQQYPHHHSGITSSSSFAISSSDNISSSEIKSSSLNTALNHDDDEEPIWIARNVEWPLPSSIPHSVYSKLYQTYISMGKTLGIEDVVVTHNNNMHSHHFSGSGLNTNRSSSSSGGTHVVDGDAFHNTSVDTTASNTGGYYTAFGGLVGKFMGGQYNNAAGTQTEHEEHLQNQRPRILRPPSAHCVASSNGWIIASIECAPVTTTTSSSNNNSSNNSSPPLRLVSRWNVRRGTSSNPVENNLIPIPPPVMKTSSSSSSTNNTHTTSGSNVQQFRDISSSSRIMHVFVDPTGCHTILSAYNGEAYYLHSTTKKVKKLAGFGPYADGTSGCQAGASVYEISSSRSNSATSSSLSSTTTASAGTTTDKIQMGLTPGSYLTSVGWDIKRGTEGSTKQILLGTSIGEVYEYSIVNHNSDSLNNTDVPSAADVGSTTDDLPMLLIRLNVDESSSSSSNNNTSSPNVNHNHGAVSGLYFERISGRENTLHTDDMPHTTNTGNDDIIVLAATSGMNKQTRLHTYKSIATGTSAFKSVFSSDDNIRSSFVELPGSINYADLKICVDGFCLRTQTGIYYGTIDHSDNLSSVAAQWSKGGGNGIVDAGILPYDSNTIPISIAITPHHIITVSDRSEVKFINRVAKKLIQKERVDWVTLSQATTSEFAKDDGIHFSGVATELLIDSRRADQVWLRRSRSLVHISSTCEDRDVWKFTLEKCLAKPLSSKSYIHDEHSIDADFDRAKSLCTNDLQKAVVIAARAEFHLSHGRTELAAQYMAQCPPSLMPFAETAIRLAIPTLGITDHKRYSLLSGKDDHIGSNVGLITYLSNKMKTAQTRNDSVACTMIGAWLVELYLHERQLGDTEFHKNGMIATKKITTTKSSMLQQFLSSNINNIDAKTVLRIMKSHDVPPSECFTYSASAGDIGTAVKSALSIPDAANGALDALRILKDTPMEHAEPFYYRYALTLLSRAPMAAAKNFLSRYSHGLSPERLLPAFMRYESLRPEYRDASSDVNSKLDSNSASLHKLRIERCRTSQDDVEICISPSESINPVSVFIDDDEASIKYFEGAITLGCKSTSVFNYLVSLYINMEDETPLFNFVSTHVSSNSNRSRKPSPLDLSYTLRLILKTGRHYRSAVKLYMGFGMRQRAVELAIKVDPSLAKELAHESTDLDEKKRLWLMIARNAAVDPEINDGNDVVSNVLSVLKDCGDGVLSIEDILPFLPDVAQIDQFKDEICDALTSYSTTIEQYLKDMSECDQVCHALHDEINRLSGYTTQMKGSAKCAFTQKKVILEKEPFYVFPSGYVALESALKKEVIPNLNEKQRSRVESIENEIVDVKAKMNNTYFHSGLAGENDAEYSVHLEELQAELDGLIAAECPLTGSIMINSIDKGFEEGKEDMIFLMKSLSHFDAEA